MSSAPVPPRKPLLSVVAPVFCEEDLIDELYARIDGMTKSIAAEFDAELVFVDDGSSDSSLQKLRAHAEKDPRVKVIALSRNFGHQIAITAGIDLAAGDIVAVMDGDLQDPPEVIVEMLAKWKEGFAVVYGVRSRRKGELFFKKLAAKYFYRFLSYVASVRIPLDAGDFRLMDRKVVNALKSVREESRYIRGLVSWLGFKQTGVTYERDARYAGTPKYTWLKSLRLAFDGIASFSERPLRLASVLGFLVMTLALLESVFVVISKILHPEELVQGWATLMVVALFLGGVQLLCLGILGEYIGRIFKEVKNRPLYFIDETYNLDARAREERPQLDVKSAPQVVALSDK